MEANGEQQDAVCAGGLLPLGPVTVIVGHYGTGKTNLSLNLAIDAARTGVRPTLVDLDIVNPYFRSSDYRELLEGRGVETVAPVFAGTTLDVPSLSGKVATVVQAATAESPAILDVGGDDVGATALGRFSETLRHVPYRMLYVVNAYRNLTQDIGYALELLRGIEERSGLKATGIVNNSHLKEETGFETVAASLPFAADVAAAAGLEVVATCVPATLFAAEGRAGKGQGAFGPGSSVFFPGIAPESLYLVQVYVHTPWEL